MSRNRILMVAFIAVLLSVALTTVVQAELPLVTAGDMRYLGAFRLPNSTINGTRFGYGGRGVAVYRDPSLGKKTILMEGHDHYPGLVAQVEIPSDFVVSNNYNDLPLANVVQNFNDIVEGKWSTLGQSEYAVLFGLIPYNGRLIVAASSWYDASCKQNASHGFSSFDLSQTGDFNGFFSLTAVANPRSLGGYMGYVPEYYQSLLGGPVMTGNNNLSIISCSAYGPAMSVFDPDKLGVDETVSATTLIYYPLSNFPADLSRYNMLASKGMAFPNGSRSILFVGTYSSGEYCYGYGMSDPAVHNTYCDPGTPTVLCCYDPCSSDKGGHIYPKMHYVWAYDANDLLEVKSGKKQPWDMRPYAKWQLTDMYSGVCAGMKSAFYDPVDGNFYITQTFGESPKVDVYRIDVKSQVPVAPFSLKVK